MTSDENLDVRGRLAAAAFTKLTEERLADWVDDLMDAEKTVRGSGKCSCSRTVTIEVTVPDWNARRGMLDTLLTQGLGRPGEAKNAGQGVADHVNQQSQALDDMTDDELNVACWGKGETVDDQLYETALAIVATRKAKRKLKVA